MCDQMDLHISQIDGFPLGPQTNAEKMRSFNRKSMYPEMADMLPETTTAS